MAELLGVDQRLVPSLQLRGQVLEAPEFGMREGQVLAVVDFDGDGKENFTDIEWKGNNILLFGSEGSGMHKHTSKYADFLVKIEIDNKVESLNISNSAAIVFHHLNYLKKKS